MNSRSSFFSLAATVGLLTLSFAPASPAVPLVPIAQVSPDFQYGSAAFNEVAQTSYQTVGLSGIFNDWITAAYLNSGVPLGDTGSLTGDLDARAAVIGAASGDEKVKLERETAAWAHRFIKKSIRKFSLDRGFELANVVKTGERQCLAQSFIISGLLQRAGLQAGAVMVWSNPKGQKSNLGHVVSVVRLSSGNDLLDDASDPTPFMHHQGLLVRVGDHYSFVKPTYEADDTISGYTLAGSGHALSVKATAPLTLSYLHSQFDYYRGERATGGILGTGTGKATPGGLKQSAFFLSRAVQEEPQNALAGFVLGQVLARQGHTAQAKAQFQNANAMYRAEGRVPAGVQEAITALTRLAGKKQ
ncbi:hypothetical protein Q0M94_19385 (plasmid) [Deinococcus radiomollis]|uniref:hypothetical protein n=1 Tax=Deinococcus radiomollis TaxID=468916 RepID=UPI0038915526